jgi:hypothetical protein
LFVLGVTGIVKVLQSLWGLWRKKLKERFDQDDLGDLEFDSNDGKNIGSVSLNNNSKFIDILISIFLFTWIGMGQYWVNFLTKLI